MTLIMSDEVLQTMCSLAHCFGSCGTMGAGRWQDRELTMLQAKLHQSKGGGMRKRRAVAEGEDRGRSMIVLASCGFVVLIRREVAVGAAHAAGGRHHRRRDGPGQDGAAGCVPGRPAPQPPLPADHHRVPCDRAAPVAARAAPVVPALSCGCPARVPARRHRPPPLPLVRTTPTLALVAPVTRAGHLAGFSGD